MPLTLSTHPARLARPLGDLRLEDERDYGRAACLLGEASQRGLEVPEGLALPADAATVGADAIAQAVAALCGDAPLVAAHAGADSSLALAEPAIADGARALRRIQELARQGPVLVAAANPREGTARATVTPRGILVESCWGWPGGAEDRFLVDARSFVVRRAEVAKKPFHLAPGETGTLVEAHARLGQAESPSLTHEEASRIAEQAASLSELVGGPVQAAFAVEWLRSRRLRLLGFGPAPPQSLRTPVPMPGSVPPAAAQAVAALWPRARRIVQVGLSDEGELGRGVAAAIPGCLVHGTDADASAVAAANEAGLASFLDDLAQPHVALYAGADLILGETPAAAEALASLGEVVHGDVAVLGGTGAPPEGWEAREVADAKGAAGVTLWVRPAARLGRGRPTRPAGRPPEAHPQG